MKIYYYFFLLFQTFNKIRFFFRQNCKTLSTWLIWNPDKKKMRLTIQKKAWNIWILHSNWGLKFNPKQTTWIEFLVNQKKMSNLTPLSSSRVKQLDILLITGYLKLSTLSLSVWSVEVLVKLIETCSGMEGL